MSFVKYTMVSRVESTTVYLMRDIADMASLCIWMHPFAIKDLESQYTNITTLRRGDTGGFSNNVVFDDNEQMTAHSMCRNPFKGGNLA